MFKEYELNKKELPFALRITINVVVIAIVVFLIKACLSFYHNVYKPKERAVINASNYAYKIIQEELTQYYKVHGYIYKGQDEPVDDFCVFLSSKLAKLGGECTNKPNLFGYQKNFVIDNTDIEVWGMDSLPKTEEGTLVKEFFIDTNGEKGENQFGIDRIPLKIYSTGRLGGLVLPVNCSKEHEEQFGFQLSKMCSPEIQINYLDTNKYFGYDIFQIGGDFGKTRPLNRNVSFLRGDCVAFGGELIAQYEFCDAKMYPWLPACYDEFPCAIQIAKEKL